MTKSPGIKFPLNDEIPKKNQTFLMMHFIIHYVYIAFVLEMFRLQSFINQ